MAALTDRLDYVLGKKAAGPLDGALSAFAPSTTCCGTTRASTATDDGARRGRGPELEEGEHVTFVDTVTEVDMKPMRRRQTKKMKKPKWLRVTLGSRRPEVTATFFNAGTWPIDKLAKGTRVMLSGEVSYFKGTCN